MRARAASVPTTLIERLGKARIGNPREDGVTMGALASRSQLQSVREAVAEAGSATTR